MLYPTNSVPAWTRSYEGLLHDVPTQVQLEYACESDLPWLEEINHGVLDDPLRRRVANQQVVMARLAGSPAGCLRFGCLWDTIPIMYLLFVEERLRGRGIGTSLVTFWEREMHAAGFRSVMTTTQADESAQHFYRKLGYHDIGGFVLPSEPMELVLHKQLGQG
jgi:GNAT superfamily N-acetyltransferase